MSSEIILWLYVANLILLILHEMDSAYWKEWILFRLPGDITGFLLLHVPLYALGLSGLVLLARSQPVGYFVAGLAGAAGTAAFFLHSFFLKKGQPEFNTRTSRRLLAAVLISSVVLLAALAWQLVSVWF